jgi:hypothetical protein
MYHTINAGTMAEFKVELKSFDERPYYLLAPNEYKHHYSYSNYVLDAISKRIFVVCFELVTKLDLAKTPEEVLRVLDQHNIKYTHVYQN